MRELPSGTVTLLFTDIEGSTHLLQELGREAYVRALTEHRRLLREAFTRHGGVEVEMQGDSFHFSFPFARDAVSAAVAGQRALHEHEWGSQPIQVRIGLHTGEPMQADGLYAGLDVHRAARVMSAAHGGQVLLSQRTAELVDEELAAGITLLDLGEHWLKDLTAPQRLYQAVTNQLPSDFPPLKTVSTTNLPRPASSFIGRDRELADVLARIEGARLLTLTGPGGSGKTRLALEAAASLVPEYDAGVYWVGLAALRDPALVTETIAQTLGAKNGLIKHIRERELLLLLDNLEQVIDAARELAGLLESCPNLTLLVTSRELLRVQGEVEYAVLPLAEREAVALFCERAQAAPSDDIGELCRRLDSLPLAVELAAAWVKTLSPAQILEHLSRNLDLLRGGRDADPRQQTLRATMKWSYDLLTLEEQRLFRWLSVFAGGCTLTAAQEVCAADLDTLQSLVQKSLVRFSGERFWMLETIREYARDRLEKSGEACEAASKRGEFFVELAGRGPGDAAVFMRREWGDQLEAERDNLRATLAWSLAAGRAEDAHRLAIAYGDLCAYRGPQSEGRSWLDAVLHQEGSVAGALRQRTLRSAISLASRQRDIGAARALAEERLELARAIDDPEAIGHALLMLGVVEGMAASFARAEALEREALSVLSASGNERLVRETLGMLGWLAIAQGNYPEAHALCEEALRRSREAGDMRGVSLSGGNLGHVLAQEGKLDQALELQREALLIARDIFDLTSASSTLVEIASVAIARRDYEPAAVLVGAAAALFEETEFTLDSVLLTSYDEILGVLKAEVGTDRLALATLRGRELPLDEIITYAVEFIDSTE